MRLVAIALAAVVSACAGFNAALEYTGTPVQPFKDTKDTWRIFDKADEGRLMITPSIGRAALQGAGSGITLGALDTDTPKSVYQKAAEGFLSSMGRSCKITDGYKLIDPQWEFKYTC